MPPEIPDMLLWLDLEMTGLDPSKQRIIEVAAVVTGYDLKEVGRYEAVIHHDDEVLEAAEDWSKEHLKKLFDEVRRSDRSEEQVVSELGALIDEHFPDGGAVPAGNSVHQDCRFIRRWWPDIDRRLHFRLLDVTAFKLWILGTSGKRMKKSAQHRALGDIEESIAELKWCLEQLKSPAGTGG